MGPGLGPILIPHARSYVSIWFREVGLHRFLRFILFVLDATEGVLARIPLTENEVAISLSARGQLRPTECLRRELLTRG